MTFTFGALLDGIVLTLRSPRAGARAAIGFGLSTGDGWAALWLTAVVSTLLSSISLMLLPVPMEPALALLFGDPLRLAMMQVAVLSIGVLLVHGIGRRFGGKGNLAETLAVISWLEAILVVVQAVQLLAMIALPALADVLGWFGFVLFLWLLAQFVAELHGFASAWKTLAGILAIGIALSLTLAFLLALGGVASV